MSRPYSKRGPTSAFGGRGGGGGRGHPGNSYNNNNSNNNNSNNSSSHFGSYSRRGGRLVGGGGVGRGGGGRGGGGGGRFMNNSSSNNNSNNRGPMGGKAPQQNGKGGGNAGSENASASVMKTLLKLLFEKSYSQIFVEESGMLVLTNMRGSSDLESAQKSVDFNSVAFCKVLAEVLRDVFASRLRILQLDNNQIRKLGVLLGALAEADVHRGIIAISAKDNELADLSFLGSLRTYENLSELLLVGNPIVNEKDYRTQTLQQLKQLKMLDGEAIVRRLLTMPNPVPAPAPDANKMAVLLMLEQGLVHAMDERDFAHVPHLYSPHGALSIGRAVDPLPPRLPLDAAHYMSDFSKQSRESLLAELGPLRAAMHWRNLVSDIQSMRNVARGREEVVRKLRAMCGSADARRALRVRQELNSNANVAFLEAGVKVPVCVLTLHGKMRFVWSPVDAVTQHPLYAHGKEPFLSTFFDRTLAMTWDAGTSTWSITNDMLFLRPDRVVVHDDGTPSQALYFANSPPRVAQLQRRLMPDANSELMATLVNCATSDQQVQEMVYHLRSLPLEQMQQAMSSSEALRAALQI